MRKLETDPFTPTRSDIFSTAIQVLSIAFGGYLLYTGNVLGGVAAIAGGLAGGIKGNLIADIKKVVEK